MTDDIPQRINGNERLIWRGRYVHTRFLLEVGDTAYLIVIAEGRIASITRGPFVMPSWDFALRAPAGAWEKFWLPVPPPGFHDLFALLKQRLLRIEGDFHPLMANLFYFKEVIAALRLGGA